MPKTPKRAGQKPRKGSRFLAGVLAENVKVLRRLRGDLSQDDLAARMRALGHETWSRATVSELEREGRSLAVDELLTLCQILDATVPELLDPAGIDGRGTASLDPGDRIGPAVPPHEARAWLEHKMRITVMFDDQNRPTGTRRMTPVFRAASLDAPKDAERASGDRRGWSG